MMATVSDASLYNSGRNSSSYSYVSANAYYGYVPPNAKANNCRDTRQQQQQQQLQQQYLQQQQHCIDGAVCNRYSSLMETDDDGYENIETADVCLNNHCVIPEATGSCANGLVYHHHLRRLAGEERRLRDTSTVTAITAATGSPPVNMHRRNNRKRNSAGDLGMYEPIEMKKFRQEAVVTAAISMVQDVQKGMDWPRCITNGRYYA